MSKKVLKNAAFKDHSKLEKNEEWNNFMKKVGEVSGLVKDLASGDKGKSEAAKAVADQYLNGKIILDEDVKMSIKDNRTVINQKAVQTVKKSDSVN